MSNRIKVHRDHTHQSVFHHGLIKLIVCIVLQKKSRTWHRFLFWSGFHNEQEEKAKKNMKNKQHSFVKRIKKELSDRELVQDKVQENYSTWELEESMCEEVIKVVNGNQEHVS